MFVTSEGIEGSGKTTQLRRLASWLEARRYDFVLTKEPGGTLTGLAIRAVLLDPASRGLAPQAELHLFLADRAQHVAQALRPALDAGRLVLCDRYGDSTVAYQGHARGMGVELVRALHDAVTGETNPDLTFLLDVDPETALARARAEQLRFRPQEMRFEEEEIRFHERVREGYLRIARSEPGRVVVLDASRREEEVWEEMLRIFQERVGPTLRLREDEEDGPAGPGGEGEA